MADTATKWATGAAIASAVAAIAAMLATYVAWRVGKLQLETTSYSLMRTEMDDFDTDRMRDYRVKVCTSHIAEKPLDEDPLLAILDALERIAEGVRSRTISLRRLWTSPLGDLLTLYVAISAKQIAAEQTVSPTVLEGIEWADKKLRRYTYIREGQSRGRRLVRRLMVGYRKALAEREIERLLKIEAGLIPRHTAGIAAAAP